MLIGVRGVRVFGLLAVSETARFCGLSRSSWEHFMRTGLLPRPTHRHGNRLYYHDSEIEGMKGTIRKMRGAELKGQS